MAEIPRSGRWPPGQRPFVFSRILRLPVVSGGLGHGGHQHNPNQYMTVEGLRDFEKFVPSFLYAVSEETPLELHSSRPLDILTPPLPHHPILRIRSSPFSPDRVSQICEATGGQP
jgi:hypothetical protein